MAIRFTSVVLATIISQEKSTYSDAVGSLHSRMDRGNRMLTSQDSRHATQENSESVADYVREMQQVAYCREGLSAETHDTLLYSQLHEKLKNTT